jgi:two-component system nitrate/nitrite response regulator NarL
VDGIRILVVADDPLARAGLVTLLSSQPGCNVIGQVTSDAELSNAVSVYRPDVIVWDLGSNPEPTLERAANFRDTGVPVIALLPDATAATDVWMAGARGILLRDISAENLAATVAAAAQGLAVLDPTFAAAVMPARGSMPPLPVEELTPRELQVLRLMAEGQSNKAIARELGISEHTVKFHVNAILGKLNAQSRTEAVVNATRLGLILL